MLSYPRTSLSCGFPRDAALKAENIENVTIHERLVALGADDRETLDAEALLARVVPLGRPVVLTDEVVAAARAGDAVLLAMLLAPEVAIDGDDAAAVAEAAELDDGSRMPLDRVRAELKL